MGVLSGAARNFGVAEPGMIAGVDDEAGFSAFAGGQPIPRARLEGWRLMDGLLAEAEYHGWGLRLPPGVEAQEVVRPDGRFLVLFRRPDDEGQ